MADRCVPPPPPPETDAAVIPSGANHGVINHHPPDLLEHCQFHLQQKTCDICLATPSKYSFRCCQWRFCSTACYKTHTGSEGNSNESTSNIPPELEAACGGPRRLNPAEVASIKAVRQLGPRNAEQFKELEEDATEDLGSLTTNQTRRIETNLKLQEWYSSVSLRKAIRTIDSSVDRIGTLSNYLCDPEFNEFVLALANTIQLGDISKETDIEEDINFR